MKQNFFDPAQNNVPGVSHFVDQIIKWGSSAAIEFLNMNQGPGGGKKVDCQKFPATLFSLLQYSLFILLSSGGERLRDEPALG